MLSPIQQPAELLYQRQLDWQRRSNKWHIILERSRAWVTAGDLLPAALSATATLACYLWPVARLTTAVVLPVILALLAWRSRSARIALSDAKVGHRRPHVRDVSEPERSSRLRHHGAAQALAVADVIEWPEARHGVPGDLRQAFLAASIAVEKESLRWRP